jgi:xanthine dehydrogenase iron-sulfur cluster and FAD-binding subunit A
MRRLNRDQRARIRLTLNGRAVSAEAEPRMLLSDFLRHSLGATGTHVGCEHGVCGCCTVLIDGTAVRSCLTLAAQAEGKEVRTVESLAAPDGTLNTLQVHGLPCAQSEANRSGAARGLERPHLPLHRLCRYHGGAHGSGRQQCE